MARRKPDGAGFLTKRIKAKLNVPPDGPWILSDKSDSSCIADPSLFRGRGSMSVVPSRERLRGVTRE
jgi:hypothetical protein